MSTILTAERTDEVITINGFADESSWGEAKRLVVTLRDGSIGIVEVSLKALYDTDYIYIYATWPDATESATKRMWTFNRPGNWSFSEDEDRISFFWNIDDSVAGFNIGGCAMLCHGDRMHTNAPSEKADSWHWKASRTNPLGYADDKYVNSTVLPYEGGLKLVGRHGDQRISGGYMQNINEEGAAPRYYEPEARDAEDARFLFQSEIDAGEAVAITDETSFKKGDIIPGYILERPVGSRGDIDARGVWRDGLWGVEHRRKLRTGHGDDVEFDTTLTYRFGIAVMDNTGGFEAFGKGHSFDLGARTLEFGGIGSEEVTQLALIRDYLITAKAHVRSGKPGLAITTINDALMVYNDIRDAVAGKDPELYMAMKNGFVSSKRNPTLENIAALTQIVDDTVLTFQGKRQPKEPTWNLKLLVAWGRIQLYAFVLLALIALYPLYKMIQMGRKPELRYLSIFLLIVMSPIFLEGVGRFGILSGIQVLQNFSFTTNEYITLLWALWMFIGMYVARRGFMGVDETIKSLQYYSSELERKMEELRRSQEQLIKSERLASIGQLAASVGHELRNPLGVIKNVSYYLGMKLSDKDKNINKHLKILEVELATSDKIISDLLDFSRGLEPTLLEAEVNPIVEEALSRATISEDVEVSVKLDKGLPRIPLDREQMQRVFLNLISNAVQAMPEGGSLEIRTGREDGFVWIEFTDTGVGISEEGLGKIFEPLFTTRAKGIGLGLALSKQIVEGHGGSIEVKSVLNTGTTFTVKLPMENGEGDEWKS